MDPVSQFKFACPVCGQHLEARASEAGHTTECPSCFKKLTVPQAPSQAGNKLMITASLADTRRLRTSRATEQPARSPAASSRLPWVYILPALLALVITVGGVLYLRRVPAADDANSKTGLQLWTDDVKELTLLDTPAAGRLNGRDFAVTTAFWRDTQLILRQNGGEPEALRVQITFPLKGGELVSGKTFRLGPEDPPFATAPKIIWKNENGRDQQEPVAAGYILWIRFDEVSKATISGRIHLCLADPEKSWVAGRFSAEIKTRARKPST